LKTGIAAGAVFTVAAVTLASKVVHRETPIERICLKVDGMDSPADAHRRCRCADDILRRQLDAPAYDALSDTASTIIDRPDASAGIAAKDLRRFWSQSSTLDKTLAAADLGVAVTKAASRCS
jgi:hypothetical protein